MDMRSYDHKKIEKKWREKWDHDGLYVTPDGIPGKENFFTLVEYPYPSGNLHIGHWYAFAVPDIFARFKRMQGYNVLFPIGFDSFGLPAENAAIKNKVDPKEWTYHNIDTMTKQLQSIGAMFDWSRKVVASDPSYYRWTQWLFLQLYQRGLAYQGEAVVNWDPVDQTVLANEQVLPDGTAERSGAVVEKKKLKQWFLKITDYAERLLTDLDTLNWPEEIKQAERAWIGKSEGAEISFQVSSSSFQGEIKVFTTRPDTLFGATYLVLAPEHPLVAELTEQSSNKEEIGRYIALSSKKSELERQEDKEKTGVWLEGITAINPGTKEEIPVFIADYVLSGYGTGAIMAVPAHDERDRDFLDEVVTRELRESLQIRYVIKPETLKDFRSSYFPQRFRVIKEGESIAEAQKRDEEECFSRLLKAGRGDKFEGAYLGYSGPGTLINSGEFDGLSNEEAKQKITEHVGGRMKTTYRLRDWSIGRQRYWGCPIPIVYDPEGNPHPVPDEHLPWTLPTDVDFKPTGVPPLARSQELRERVEKIFGAGWTPEVDTLDTFVDSSWYYLRYTNPHNDKEFASKDKLAAWLPVKRYSGGAEHTTLHLLYSRFFHKALFDLGLVNESEPYLERFNRGIILGSDGRKMSKRWGNVIDPDEHVKNVGADSVRMYLGFIGPYQTAGSYPWDTNGLIGIRRFLERVYGIGTGAFADSSSSGIEQELHRTIKKVSEDIPAFKFNTAISQMMICINRIEREGVSWGDFETFLKVCAPFAPHLADELWEMLGHANSIHTEMWPSFDEAKLLSESAIVAIQINGKVRGTIVVQQGALEDAVLTQAQSEASITRWLLGKEITKMIYVPGRLLSIVAKER